jgi:signal transduction histidine kinase
MTRSRRRTLSSRFAWRAAALTAVVVGVVGVASLLFWQDQVESAVEDGVADHLAALEAELDLAAVGSLDTASPVVLPTPEQFVQVITPDGRVVATSSELARVGPVLEARDVLASAPADYVGEINDPRSQGESALVMARRIEVDGSDLIGIVGASLNPVAAARSSALLILAIGIPLLAAIIGYGVWLAVTYALRPVNELAHRADDVAKGAAPWKLGVGPDTIELHSLAQSLDALLDHLRESFESERRFLDDASHELRTPIAVARGELDLLRPQVSGAPDLAEAVESAIEELDRLDRLAADLLLLARARGSRPALSRCDLAGLARRATSTVLKEPGQRDVHVRVLGSAFARGDENALTRVFLNTVANAVAHCRDDVSIDLSEQGETALAVITDDGSGFPAEMTGSSFPRFATGRGRRTGGTGLGLAIAAAIVEAHGGHVKAENLPDGGARVIVQLPAANSPISGDEMSQGRDSQIGSKAEVR